MALCLPRKRSATSLATRPSTLSVASITNHSCFTSAGLALKVFMSVFRWSALVAGHAITARLRLFDRVVTFGTAFGKLRPLGQCDAQRGASHSNHGSPRR